MNTTWNKRLEQRLWLIAVGAMISGSNVVLSADWAPGKAPLMTRWAKEVRPDQALPEYPRPQMVREQWLNLNGLWDYAITALETARPDRFDGQILVPFPIESALSGVTKRLDEKSVLWYRRSVELPAAWQNQRVLLHFGAVDWEATVQVNGREIGRHRGGYDEFSFDITDTLKANGLQELVVAVWDPTEADQARGKQSRRPQGIFYTPASGIWQTVWLEPVPAQYIRGLKLTPEVDGQRLRLEANSPTSGEALQIEAVASDSGKAIARVTGPANAELSLPIPWPKLWSPDQPFLYDLTVRLKQGDRVLDQVSSYFGMRKVTLGQGAQGLNRLWLNGQFLMQIGTLDQGFWPDGIYTAPTDAALRYDIELLKGLGFNMTRKHVKVEPARWYYWCDKLGLLVWQDMPSANNRTAESKLQFEQELKQLVAGRYNHPSIILWVVFNEGWGQHDTERLTRWVKELDPSRLVNNASGWTDKLVGDVNDIHRYPGPGAPPPEAARAAVLGEFGGLGLGIDGHTWSPKTWGYQGMADSEKLTQQYVRLLQKVWELKDQPGLSAAVYTQTTDVETECNGLITYDRAVIKVDPEKTAAANRGEVARSRTVILAPCAQQQSLAWRYTLATPGTDWFKPGFDDGAWKEGRSGFGTRDTPGALVRTVWDTADIWLRRELDVSAGDYRRAQLWMHHDEDAEVYLNGVLAAKVSGYVAEYGAFELLPEAKATLKPGRNLIAVHCHQTSGGQYIDAGLVSEESRVAEVQLLRRVPGTALKAHYVSNRPPLRPSAFVKLPIGSITPRGWLRHQLELASQGMIGRLKEVSPWVQFESNAWTDKEGQGHSGWEEMPYWLKGYGDLGYVLKDPTILQESRRWIEAVLATQTADGWFGPRELQKSLDGKPDLWPHMVMLNVLQSYYEYSGDARILPFMTRYFAWQHRLPPASFGAGFWPRMRAGDNLESVYWLYNRTGDAWLLDLTRKIHDNMADWTTSIPTWHNVNLAQGFRQPGVYYLQAKNSSYLQAAERNYDQILGLYGQFPGGGFGGDENCRPGFTDPRQAIETCGIIEFMHSFEMLTKISGDPLWADRCEDIAFNSAPAAMTPDLKALHYLTSANQIQLDRQNKSPGVQNEGTMFSYSPYRVYRCCQHNVSHGWPYYAEELWLATTDRGLCASLYAASEVKAKVGDGTEVTIAEATDYPFSDTIRLALSAAKPVSFPLYLRVPRWCRSPEIRLNDEPLAFRTEPLSYLVIHRTWQPGDVITLRLPMSVAVRTWPKNQNSVSVDYGPLTFALKIGERWERYGGAEGWPEWEVFPTTPWNYGLVLDAQNPAGSFELLRQSGPLAQQPFKPETAPLELRVKARRLPAWQPDRTGLVGVLQPSPARSDEPEETVSLIPMGAARLRINSFPTIGTGDRAHEWIAPIQPQPTAHSTH